MKYALALVCLLVSSLLSGCAWFRDGGGSEDPTARARAPTRSVKVYVVADAQSEDISVDEEPIHRKRGITLPIVFHVLTRGYSFPATDAVTFDDPKQRPAPGEIVCKTTTSGELAYREVVCTNLHKEPGRYKYTLRILNKDHKPLEKLDPFISNQ